jgi:hypothetical protein
MGEKLCGFRNAPSSIEFGPGLYARHDYAPGDVIVELPVNIQKLEGAMVGDGWYNCAVLNDSIVASIDIKKGDEIVVGNFLL